LRQRADEVPEVTDEIRALVADLFDTMYAAEGIGLAANQVGLTQRVAVVDVEDHPPLVLINPVIVEREGETRLEEGCLSIPDLFGDVDRAERIVLETTLLDGTRQLNELKDLPARAVQHEIDHLDGVLFVDHLGLLKRRMLLKKWKKLRKGTIGYLKEVSPASASGP
jgi:peptide deformylase